MAPRMPVSCWLSRMATPLMRFYHANAFRPSSPPLIVEALLRLTDDPPFFFELRLIDLPACKAFL
jgi:hypothetical protein